MSWDRCDVTPCHRCGVPGGESHLNPDQVCTLCQLEIAEGIVWPWFISETTLNTVIDLLERCR